MIIITYLAFVYGSREPIESIVDKLRSEPEQFLTTRWEHSGIADFLTMRIGALEDLYLELQNTEDTDEQFTFKYEASERSPTPASGLGETQRVLSDTLDQTSSSAVLRKLGKTPRATKMPQDTGSGNIVNTSGKGTVLKGLKHDSRYREAHGSNIFGQDDVTNPTAEHAVSHEPIQLDIAVSTTPPRHPTASSSHKVRPAPDVENTATTSFPLQQTGSVVRGVPLSSSGQPEVDVPDHEPLSPAATPTPNRTTTTPDADVVRHSSGPSIGTLLATLDYAESTDEESGQVDQLLRKSASAAPMDAVENFEVPSEKVSEMDVGDGELPQRVTRKRARDELVIEDVPEKRSRVAAESSKDTDSK